MKALLASLSQIKRETQKWHKLFFLSLGLIIFFFYVTKSFNEKKSSSEELLITEKKGLELLDEISWAKKEKELNVLHMRALKGQLEKDLVLFENIQNAQLTLDLQTNADEKSKASILLTLKPHTHLTLPQLRAISCHVAGAFRGLDPSQVAISDTSGKFYQGFENVIFTTLSKVAIEEDLKPKIENIVSSLWKNKSFALTMNVLPEEKYIGISLLLEGEGEVLFEEILKAQIANLISGMEIKLDVHRVPKNIKENIKKESPFFSISFLFLFCLFLLSLFALILFGFRFFQKKAKAQPANKKEESENLSLVMKKINFSTLSSLIKEEPPSTIALMMSYLEKDRQEALLAQLPTSVSEEVLYYLGQRDNQ